MKLIQDGNVKKKKKVRGNIVHESNNSKNSDQISITVLNSKYHDKIVLLK